MFAFDVTKWVPKFILRDKNGYALAKAIEAGVNMMNEAIRRGVACISDYDTMPEWRLDELAWEFRIDWWDPDYTLEQKRRTVKDSWYVYRYLGTKASVERAISAIYPDTAVQEWFEYGGKPFYFKLLIDVSFESVTPEKHARVMERVGFYKNLRSVLEGVEYAMLPEGQPDIRAGVALAGLRMELKAEVLL